MSFLCPLDLVAFVFEVHLTSPLPLWKCRAVPVQPLQLEDDKEFPPLSRPPEPVIMFSRKEFPPLRTCLKSQKSRKWKKDFKEVHKGV